MSQQLITEKPIPTSADLAALLKRLQWGNRPTLVAGYGTMGAEYVKALKALGATNLTVCSRSVDKLAPLKTDGIKTVSGGYKNLSERVSTDAVAVVATSTHELIPCTRHLLSLGYKTILCEKPVSLWSSEIKKLAEETKDSGARLYAAFNRIAYPSVIEAKSQIAQDGGPTSAFYTFTELVHRMNMDPFTEEEKTRWGVANSIHVINLAHGLIGFPASLNGLRSGTWPWHPNGSRFVGAGVTHQQIPYSYHADWGSAGRWSVEVFTKKSAYRFCPLEKLQKKKLSLSDWEDVPVATFDPALKTGLAEQLAAMIDNTIFDAIGPLDLFEAAQLTKFTEDVFGYSHENH